MKVCLAGLGTQPKFQSAVQANPVGLVLDYVGSQKRYYDIPEDTHLILRSELHTRWAKCAHLWDETSPDVGSEDDRIKAMSTLMKRLDDIIDWSKRYEYSYISLEMPRLMYEELPPDFQEFVPNLMFTVKDLRDLSWAINNFTMVGISSDIDLAKFRSQLSENMEIVRDRNVLFHGWGRTDKATLLSGIFYSVDSSSWSTGKFGNVYQYLGNLYVKVYNPRRKTSANIKQRLVEEAVSLGIDRDLFLEGNKHALNAFNAHQWTRLGRDADLLSGYWSASSSFESKNMKKKV